MAKLGFIGLGIMGYPMARNLLRAGHEVALWSHTESKARELAAAEKGIFCSTPRQVGEFADFVFLCVGDSAMSEQAILGVEGVAAGARPGTVVVDTSTVSPASSLRITGELQRKGVGFLGAPVTGSKPGAEKGALTFMVGGEREVFDRVRPYMEIMGDRIYYCGGPGAGLCAKLTQNLILSNLIQAFNEGLVLSTKAGVNPELMLDILANSAARSGLIEFKAPYVLDRNFETNFSNKWMHKDVGLILNLGAELGVPLPLTSITRQMFQAALSIGLGEEDFCASIKVLERLAGVEVKRTAA
jgi:3-hydroxyisobutyrate dehydrogenase-like beta-hydroxyacid dehydrogenase